MATRGYRASRGTRGLRVPPGLLETLGLHRHFETVATSHLEGVEKPDPEIFHRVLGRLGAASSEALHVGDAVELDVAGARAAGIAAVLLDRVGDGDTETPVIRDLRDLPRIAKRGR